MPNITVRELPLTGSYNDVLILRDAYISLATELSAVLRVLDENNIVPDLKLNSIEVSELKVPELNIPKLTVSAEGGEGTIEADNIKSPKITAVSEDGSGEVTADTAAVSSLEIGSIKIYTVNVGNNCNLHIDGVNDIYMNDVKLEADKGGG